MKRFSHRTFLATALVAFLAGCSRSPDAHNHVAASAPTAAETPSAGPKYHCPMHPTYVADRLGDCPICGMSLVPIKSVASSPSDGHAAVPGRAAIELGADKRQLIGLTLATVERRALDQTVRAVAVVEHDETRTSRIAPRFGGWVRKLHVAFTGATVVQGAPLLTVYSPEVYAAQNDYLVAWRALRHLPADAPSARRSASAALLDAARARLELWELDAAELRALEERDAPNAELVIRSPRDGHVLTKQVVEGKAFMAGETLYEIADLSHLWLQARVAETDLPLLAIGQESLVTFASAALPAFTAPVTFIDPHIDPVTRRGTVRFETDNPGHRLRPDLWAEVEIEISLCEKLVVPAAAVIDTGKRQIAFVAAGDRLEPRVVKLGARTSEFLEVRDGLDEGEQVVSRALFLVDSESQLQAAIAGMGAAGEHKH
jgi:Cu(I)/Ag(I) efflux system membrane fusion protein